MSDKYIELMDVLIGSSIGIYQINRQTEFNRIIPLKDLAVERVSQSMIDFAVTYGERIHVPTTYCPDLRGFIMTIDLMTVCLSVKQARKLTGLY
jgi:hypothetical protein